MKKLIVAMLVVGLASVASAGLALDVFVDGAPYADNVSAGSVVTLNFKDTVGGALMGGFGAVNIGIDQGTFTSVTAHPGTLGNGFTGAADGAGFAVTGDMTYMFTPAPADNVVLSIVFEATGTPIEVAVAGGYNAADISGLSTTLVPEPMTLGLLGLGGLFLRRRK